MLTARDRRNRSHGASGIASTPDAGPSYPVIVVLPVYNEQDNIGRLLDRIDEHLRESFLQYEVIAVDDGSADRSLAILEQHAQRLPIRICRHGVNQGLGPTLRDGLADAHELA